MSTKISTLIISTGVHAASSLQTQYCDSIDVVSQGIALWCVCVCNAFDTIQSPDIFWHILMHVQSNLTHLFYIINGKIIIFIKEKVMSGHISTLSLALCLQRVKHIFKHYIYTHKQTHILFHTMCFCASN